MTDPAQTPVTTKPPAWCDIADHPNEAMNGRVEFKLPDLYTETMIERRMVELANLGAGPDSPRINPADLSVLGFQRVKVIATLEYAIKRAPKAFYVEENGEPRLAPAALPPFELELNTSTLWLVYLAYQAWVESFRPVRARTPGTDPETAPQPADGAGSSPVQP